MDLYPRRRPFGSHPGPACRGCPDVHCGLRCSSLLRVARTTPSSLVASPRAWHLAQHDPPPHPAPANPVVSCWPPRATGGWLRAASKGVIVMTDIVPEPISPPSAEIPAPDPGTAPEAPRRAWRLVTATAVKRRD
jgi:hypothetical protein